MSLCDVCVRALCLQPASSGHLERLWCLSSLLHHSNKRSLIVLFAQADFCKCSWMGGDWNHTVYRPSNKPAACHSSPHWFQPLSASLPPLRTSHGTVLTGDLCNLWLLNHVDTRVIHVCRGCLCPDPNAHSNFSTAVAHFAGWSVVLSLTLCLLKLIELETNEEHVWNQWMKHVMSKINKYTSFQNPIDLK